MLVSYIVMQFPGPAETFAATDIKALQRAGARVSVHGFRPRPRDCAGMMAERGVADLPVSHGSPRGALRGLAVGLRRPALLWALLCFVARAGRARPAHLVKGLVLVPRALDIFAELSRARPDVVHLFWGHYPVLVGFLARRYLPDAVLSVFLGAYDLETRYEGTRLLAPRADAVWTQARANLPAIRALGVPDRLVEVSYRGLDMRRRPRGAGKVGRRIACAGRLVPGKRTDQALRVFRHVRARWPDATLVVMGGGRQRRSLEALARTLGVDDAVTFLGHVSHSAVYDRFAEAELCLMMSQDHVERLPNVVKEAMACGCVCIAAPSTGIEELIEDGRTGFVVEPEDIDTILERVARVFDSPAAAGRMRAAARRVLAERFDADRSMARHFARWKEIAAAKPRGPARRFTEV